MAVDDNLVDIIVIDENIKDRKLVEFNLDLMPLAPHIEDDGALADLVGHDQEGGRVRNRCIRRHRVVFILCYLHKKGIIVDIEVTVYVRAGGWEDFPWTT